MNYDFSDLDNDELETLYNQLQDFRTLDDWELFAKYIPKLGEMDGNLEDLSIAIEDEMETRGMVIE